MLAQVLSWKDCFAAGGLSPIRQTQMKYLKKLKINLKIGMDFFVFKAFSLKPIMTDKVRFLYCWKVFVIYQPLLHKILPKAWSNSAKPKQAS